MKEPLIPVCLVKDPQSMENVNWQDCVLVLRIAPLEIELGLYKKNANYFFRLSRYRFDTPPEGKTLTGRLEGILKNSKAKIEACAQTELIIDTSLFTAIPAEFYKDGNKQDFFELVYGSSPELELLTDTDFRRKWSLVYGVDKLLWQFAKDHFPSFHFRHQISELSEIMYSDEVYEHRAYLILHEQFISILILEGENPLLVQPFPTPAPTDVIYHFSNAVGRLNLPEDIPVFVLGERQEDTVIMKELKAEFPQAVRMGRPGIFQFPPQIKRIPPHSFYHLVSLMLCESLEENLVEEE